MLGVPAASNEVCRTHQPPGGFVDGRRAGDAAFVEGGGGPGADQRRVRVGVGPGQAAVGRLHHADALLEVGRVGARVEAVDAASPAPATATARRSATFIESKAVPCSPSVTHDSKYGAPSGPGDLLPLR